MKQMLKCAWCNYRTPLWTTKDGKSRMSGWERLREHVFRRHEEIDEMLNNRWDLLGDVEETPGK